MGTGALTRCCCCCEGKVAGGPLVGGGGGMKKEPIGAYPPSLLLYEEGVGDVEDLLKLNTFDRELCKDENKFTISTQLSINCGESLPGSPSMCQTKNVRINFEYNYGLV